MNRNFLESSVRFLLFQRNIFAALSVVLAVTVALRMVNHPLKPALLNETWTHCAKTLADADTVACCRENATQVEGIVGLMDQAKRETVALGAEPEVPPTREEKFHTDDETPIRDHEQPPASPIRP